MPTQTCRKFKGSDLTDLLEKIFTKYDLNNDGSISKF
jgi:Ca2+-binding EF-hand superfamily protein